VEADLAASDEDPVLRLMREFMSPPERWLMGWMLAFVRNPRAPVRLLIVRQGIASTTYYLTYRSWLVVGGFIGIVLPVPLDLIGPPHTLPVVIGVGWVLIGYAFVRGYQSSRAAKRFRSVAGIPPGPGYRLNPRPGWPMPPEGFIPPRGWRADPSWPPPPKNWRYWKDA
jgi:hypothetical protein